MCYDPFLTPSVGVEQQTPCFDCDDALTLAANGTKRDRRSNGAALKGSTAVTDDEEEDTEYEEFSVRVSAKYVYGVERLNGARRGQTGLGQIQNVLLGAFCDKSASVVR